MKKSGSTVSCAKDEATEVKPTLKRSNATVEAVMNQPWTEKIEHIVDRTIITITPKKTALSDAEINRLYENQITYESRFQLLNVPQRIYQIYLPCKSRPIEAKLDGKPHYLYVLDTSSDEKWKDCDISLWFPKADGWPSDRLSSQIYRGTRYSYFEPTVKFINFNPGSNQKNQIVIIMKLYSSKVSGMRIGIKETAKEKKLNRLRQLKDAYTP